uniref:Uncharacterized protein n=1 Tax=Arion vulgaris TaxID=1028688 RepID=A0A0B7A3H2_9EUPU
MHVASLVGVLIVRSYESNDDDDTHSQPKISDMFNMCTSECMYDNLIHKN